MAAPIEVIDLTGDDEDDNSDGDTIFIPETVIIAMRPFDCLNHQRELEPWVLQQAEVRCHMSQYMKDLLDMRPEDLDDHTPFDICRQWHEEWKLREELIRQLSYHLWIMKDAARAQRSFERHARGSS